MSAQLSRGRRPLSAAWAAMATCALVTACGGGGDEPLPDTAYISWTSSVNTVRILDWNNEAFAVRTDTGQVARYSDDLLLTGMVVIGTTLYYNSAPIGAVTYTVGVNGGRITDFTCNNGRELDITVTGSGNSASYTWRCV